MSFSGKYLLAGGMLLAMIWGTCGANLAQAGEPHNATFKALGQHNNYSRSYRSYNYSNNAAPTQQRSFSVAPEATDVPPAPVAETAPAPVPHVAQPAAPSARRSYSYNPEPVYSNPGYRSYRSNVPAYALPRAMRN